MFSSDHSRRRSGRGVSRFVILKRTSTPNSDGTHMLYPPHLTDDGAPVAHATPPDAGATSAPQPSLLSRKVARKCRYLHPRYLLQTRDRHLPNPDLYEERPTRHGHQERQRSQSSFFDEDPYPNGGQQQSQILSAARLHAPSAHEGTSFATNQ